MNIKVKFLENRNMQLGFLLVTLIGLLFSIFPIKYNTPFNIFIPGILLLILPVIYLLIWKNEHLTRREEIFILILIMLTIFFNHYIFALRFNSPIGTDAPYALSITHSFLSDTAKIDFAKISGASSGFPGLYILYNILLDITGLNLNTLATYLPPAINMSTFVFFYILIRRFFGSRLSLIAIFVSGWEHTVFKFGFEYRTQSLAIVMYMAILALIVFIKSSEDSNICYKNKHEIIKSNSVYIILLILVLMAALTITHFVTIVVLIITFLIIYSSLILSQSLNLKVDLKISLNIILISFVLFLSYMIYMGQFFDGVFRFVWHSFMESFSSEPFGPESKTQGVVGFLYGALVFYITWLTRIFFIGSSIIFLYKIKRASDLFIISWAGTLAILTLIISVVGAELNPGRLYNFFSFPFSIILSFGFIYLIGKNISFPKSYIKLIISIFLILFVITSLLKLSNSIIGDTEPFRGYQSVDNIHWEKSSPNYRSNDYFINKIDDKNVIFDYG